MPTTPRNALDFETLDERLVPSATVLDLTTQGATATAANGAIVEQVDPQPMGTGHIHAFVRIQGDHADGTEQGYNTDGRPLQFDEKTNANFTRSINLGSVPVVEVNGVNYREFLLDINQDQKSPLLSLDEVQMFLGATGNLTGYDTSTGTATLSGLAPVFDLSPGGSTEVLLNSALTSGLGSGDMALLVPDANFAGADPNSYLYLYSHFGAMSGATANGGYEQWSVPSNPPNQVPPAIGSISGGVFQAGSNTPLANVTILLQGTDINGNTVSLSTTTDANGLFSFGNLAAGTYSIFQQVPTSLTDVAQQVGTINGTQVGTSNVGAADFTDVTLGNGQNGIQYYFFDSNLS
jgi:hypothetical protein